MRATEEAKSAEAARDVAVEVAEEASRKTSPISVFISRKTQRYYIRQGYKPVLEGPVTIQDPDRPTGSYVFTALSGADSRVRWGVVSMYGDKQKTNPEPVAERISSKKGETRRNVEPVATDVDGAKEALNRITIPEAVQNISNVVLPGSSLIISDEGLSIETGKDTDFVVVMSGEPQGALKVRQREPKPYNDGWGGYGKGGGGGFFWKF
jgi:hypothetical protein